MRSTSPAAGSIRANRLPSSHTPRMALAGELWLGRRRLRRRPARPRDPASRHRLRHRPRAVRSIQKGGHRNAPAGGLLPAARLRARVARSENRLLSRCSPGGQAAAIRPPHRNSSLARAGPAGETTRRARRAPLRPHPRPIPQAHGLSGSRRRRNADARSSGADLSAHGVAKSLAGLERDGVVNCTRPGRSRSRSRQPPDPLSASSLVMASACPWSAALVYHSMAFARSFDTPPSPFS